MAVVALLLMLRGPQVVAVAAQFSSLVLATLTLVVALLSQRLAAAGFFWVFLEGGAEVDQAGRSG